MQPSFTSLHSDSIPSPRKGAWLALVMSTMILGSFALSCAAPLVALAAFAALVLPFRQAILFAMAGWAVNQAIGFGFKGYPTDSTTLTWGAIMGAATLAAFAAAWIAQSKLASKNAFVTAGFALLAAFLGFQAVLLVANLVIYGDLQAFGFAVKAKMLSINVAALAIIWVMNRVAIATGLLVAPAAQAA